MSPWGWGGAGGGGGEGGIELFDPYMRDGGDTAYSQGWWNYAGSLHPGYDGAGGDAAGEWAFSLNGVNNSVRATAVYGDSSSELYPMSPGDTFVFSAVVRSDRESVTAMKLRWEFWDADGGSVDSGEASVATPGNPYTGFTWVPVTSGMVTCPADTASVGFRVAVASPDPPTIGNLGRFDDTSCVWSGGASLPCCGSNTWVNGALDKVEATGAHEPYGLTHGTTTVSEVGGYIHVTADGDNGMWLGSAFPDERFIVTTSCTLELTGRYKSNHDVNVTWFLQDINGGYGDSWSWRLNDSGGEWADWNDYGDPITMGGILTPPAGNYLMMRFSFASGGTSHEMSFRDLVLHGLPGECGAGGGATPTWS